MQSILGMTTVSFTACYINKLLSLASTVAIQREYSER